MGWAIKVGMFLSEDCIINIKYYASTKDKLLSIFQVTWSYFLLMHLMVIWLNMQEGILQNSSKDEKRAWVEIE